MTYKDHWYLGYLGIWQTEISSRKPTGMSQTTGSWWLVLCSVVGIVSIAWSKLSKDFYIKLCLDHHTVSLSEAAYLML